MSACTLNLPDRRALIIAAAVVVAAAFSDPGHSAEAQSRQLLIAQICRSHAEIEAKLLSDFGERKLGLGISGDGSLLELFAGPRGTFTVVKTTPGGLSCIVDYGESWQTLRPLEAAGQADDSFTPTRF